MTSCHVILAIQNSVNSSVELHSSFSGETAFRFFPKSKEGVLVLWLSLPLFCFLLSLCVSFLFPFKKGFLLPLISIGGIAAILQWRIWGILISSVALASLCFLFYPALTPFLRFCHGGGVLLSLEVDFILLYLVVKEAHLWVSCVSKESQILKDRSREKEAAFESEKDSLEQQIVIVKEELERWKEETLQRREEKIQDDERLQLVEAEIELLTSQKEAFLQEVYAAKRKNKNSSAVEDVDLSDSTELKKEKARIEGLYRQLRNQFEEKKALVNKTRQELFKSQERVLVSQKEQEFNAWEREYGELKNWTQVLERAYKENLDLETEIFNLEELISHILSQ